MIWSAIAGLLMWVVAPVAGSGSGPSWGSIEHMFLFMPLVAAPLAIRLQSTLLFGANARSPLLHRTAQHVQPVASAMVLASFYLPQGPLSGGLVAPWLGVGLLLAAGGASRVLRPMRANLLASMIFLPIGAVWLVLSRLGLGPRHFAPITVFLAALHFHFSGFCLQIIVAATERSLPRDAPSLHRLQRYCGGAVIAGIPLLAAGNLALSPPVKLLGVASMVVGTLALALTSAAAARAARVSVATPLLYASSIAVVAGMLLAGVYGVGERIGAKWIGIDVMVVTHGAIQAIGFTLFGLVGHLSLAGAGARSSPAIGASVSRCSA